MHQGLARYPTAMPVGRVIALHRKPRPGQLERVDALVAKAGKGLEGDRCFGQARRQVLFVSLAEIVDLGYQPGDLREQITVDLAGLQTLAEGTKLAAGDAMFEIEGDCAPCNGMAKRLGEDPEAFKERTRGRRGMLARVVSDGTLRVGDEVRVLDD